MGEAKRRKEAAELDGAGEGSHTGQANRHGSAPFHRGLLLQPPYQQMGPFGFQMRPDDLQEVHLGLLYWDKIASPVTNLFRQSNVGYEMLEREGVLIRPSINFMGRTEIINADPFIKAHISVFDELERRQPGKWALSQGDRRDLISNNIVAENTGCLVELVKAIPVPLVETPLEEILEFRLRRRPELLRLRSAIDEIHLKVTDSGDKQAALNKSAAEIELACHDLIKISRERWHLFRLADLQTLFKGSAFAGAMEAVAHSHLPSVAGMLGVAGTVLKIADDVGLRRKALRKSPYWYIAKFHRELLG